jgi:DNA mismatch endonuclease (patch repair protein)
MLTIHEINHPWPCDIIYIMVDTLTKAERSERMGRIGWKDTRPEMRVRRLVHGMGYRYRLHRRDLPGCPDLIFPRFKKALFIHGCFWHRHPDPSCKLARLPKSNLDFWLTKLEGNRLRDQRNQAALMALGWDYMIIWECELKDLKQIEIKLKMFLDGEK